MDKIKVLVISDGVAPTGFARVSHSIFSRLPSDKYDIHHLAINYWGDPHDYNYKIYPAGIRGDIYGYKRLPDFSQQNFDLIFILNDLWVVTEYLGLIKKYFTKKVPKVVIYYPVDGGNYNIEWFTHFDIVSKAVVYTEFGKRVSEETFPFDYQIIPHGIDKKSFYPISDNPVDVRKELLPAYKELHDPDSFVVLNASRNQPRKRLDIAMKGFALFAKDKPRIVKYYHHAGLTDVGWDVIRFAHQLGIDSKFVITSKEPMIQRVDDTMLNRIYNATEVGLNTSLGEGWGLPSCEHAATAAPQVVPDNSASRELFEDCGLLVPTVLTINMERTLTEGSFVSAEGVAKALNDLYMDRGLYESTKLKCYNKFTSEEYNWDNVAKQWDNLFEETIGSDSNNNIS